MSLRPLLALVALLAAFTSAAPREGECEVCISALKEVQTRLKGDTKDLLKTEAAIDKYCDKPPTEKDAKLCYFVVGVKRQQIAQPMKNGVPVEKICERLKKTSAEICALRHGSSAGAPSTEDITDFSKLRVNQLKSIMAEKGIKCPDCLEKADYVRKLEEVLGKPGGKKKEL